MLPFDPPFRTAWRASLALEYDYQDGRTRLAARRHDGPLLVQKPLYPEGAGVCHSIIIHPPAGIAGGDQLMLNACAGVHAHALLTTPGAGKWYRAGGRSAQQHLHFDAQDGACIEWLPQETIVFDGAQAELSSEIHLASGASYIGWEVLCLGRTGSGEHFRHGSCDLATRIMRNGKPVWFERGRIDAGGTIATSAAGLGGHSGCATLLAATERIGDELLEACRKVSARGKFAVTRLPGLLVARYLGESSEAARQYFVALWACLRPALAGCPAVEPRIWRT